MTQPVFPDLGDRVFLGTFLSRNNVFGVVSDLDTPDQASMSWEIAGGNGFLTVPVLQGRQGPAGSNAPVLDLQTQIYDDANELPTNLTDEDVDIGKYWIVREFDEEGDPVGSKAYIWYGTHYEWFQMGTEGPAGPVPIISWTIELLDPDDPDLDNEVIVTGDAHHPSLLLKIKAPRGPEGPATNIADAPDVDMTPPPETGDTLVYNEADAKWHPSTLTRFVPRFYTFPEGSFVDVALAFGTRVPIGTCVIPPQEYDCVPYIHGHLRILGVDLDTTPLMIGAEVRLGSTTGVLVARGWGNLTNYVQLQPHSSSGSAPNDAITPDNERGLIPAGSTGAAATLYVNCFNDGVAGVYNFQNDGAQVSVLLIPV
jgi:hypothetical protein